MKSESSHPASVGQNDGENNIFINHLNLERHQSTMARDVFLMHFPRVTFIISPKRMKFFHNTCIVALCLKLATIMLFLLRQQALPVPVIVIDNAAIILCTRRKRYHILAISNMIKQNDYY